MNSDPIHIPNSNNNNNTFGRLPRRGPVRVTPTVPPVKGQAVSPQGMMRYLGDTFFIEPIDSATPPFTGILRKLVWSAGITKPSIEVGGIESLYDPYSYRFYTALYPIGAYKRGGSRRLGRQRRVKKSRKVLHRRGKN